MSRPKPVKTIPHGGHAQQHNTQIITHGWQGPLPPPDILLQFNEIIPNGAERMMAMVEEQGRHRRFIESENIAGERDKSRWQFITKIIGQIFAIIVTLSGLFAAVYLGSIGQGYAACVVGGSTIVAIGCAFIYGERNKK